MFGKEYSNHPEVLMDSFKGMKNEYKRKAKIKQGNLIIFLQKIYISIFGVPEIGFQLRSLYFLKIVEGKLIKKNIKSILDAGSGIGVYSFWLAKKFPHSKVLGGEIDIDKIIFTKKFAKIINADNVEFEYYDITNPTKNRNKYDLIINIDVLEHVDNYKKVLKNFYELLTPRGYLYLHTPQPDQKRIFKNLKEWHHEDHVHEGFTPQELKRELNKLGFKIIDIKQTFGFFGKLAWELNHLTLLKGFIVAGVFYPFLYLIANLDPFMKNKQGLGTAILAKKT